MIEREREREREREMREMRETMFSTSENHVLNKL